MSKLWYTYLGTEDPLSTANYVRVTVKPTCLCGDRICAVLAPDTGEQPSVPFSANLQKYINDALTTGQLQPNHPYNAKKYVYLNY